MAKCNGYSNFETWSVASAIDNTESLYNFFRDGVKEMKEKFSDKDQQMITLANIIKNTMISMMPDTSSPIWGPIIHASLTSVNTREIAIMLLED